MTAELPLVSIVIPTYNRKEKLIRLIESTLRSDYTNIEIIVVDDASSDGTYESIKNIFPVVRIIRNENESFLAASRNIGMENSKGEFIFLLDDDNIIAKDTISNLIEIVNKEKFIGIVAPIMLYYTEEYTIWCAGGKLNKLLMPYHLYMNQKIDVSNLSKIINNIDYFPNAYMVRKDIIKKVRHDSKNFPYNWQEQDFCLRVKNLGYRIVTITKAKIWHDTGYNGEITRLGVFKTYDQAKSRIIFLKKYGNIYQKVFFWLFTFPISTIYYVSIILLSNDENLIKKNDNRFKIIRSYLLGTIEGIKIKTQK